MSNESGKTRAGGGRSQYARPGKKKIKAPTAGIEDAVFGFGGSYTPDTFETAHAAITRYIGAGNFGKKDGPEAAQALREFKREEPKEPVLAKSEDERRKKINDIMYKKRVQAWVEAEFVWEDNNKKTITYSYPIAPS